MSSANPPWQRSLVVLTNTVLAATIIAALFLAKKVLIPVAIALYLSFLLTPLVTAVERVGLHRIIAVIIVVTSATFFLGTVLWATATQCTALINDLPAYSENLKDKIHSLRSVSESSTVARMRALMRDMHEEWTLPSRQVTPDVEPETAPILVELESRWLDKLPAVGAYIAGTFVSIALGIVLVFFVLLKREFFRNRLIRLIGDQRLTTTTRAVDDAGARIGRFLLVQFFVNLTFGIAWGVSLYFLGMQYVLLFAFLAAILRYIPYIGTAIAALVPILLSIAQAPGWAQPFMLVLVYLVLELAASNIMEPLLYGKSVGVSEAAMLVLAAFWTLLWGPIGLVLSAPLTVCLVVLGRYVPQFQFFVLLLGDEPALEPHTSFYQRLVAKDQDEAEQVVLAQAKISSTEQIYDSVLVPALISTRRDRRKNELSEADEEFIIVAVREILYDLELPPVDGAQDSVMPHARLVACPAHDDEDSMALEMLQRLLGEQRWDVSITSADILASEMLQHIEERAAGMICIAALPPGGLAHTRYLCKRIRAQFPNIKIVVGRWGLNVNIDTNRERLIDAGADQVATTLLDTRRQLNGWLPVLLHKESHPVAV